MQATITATMPARITGPEAKSRAELAAEIVARAFLHCERLGITVKINAGKGSIEVPFRLLTFHHTDKN